MNLKRHEITPKIRAKMLDWMLNVLQVYKQKESTIFKSFFILDYFLQKYPKKFRIDDYYLYGVVAISIASKQEEIHNIRLETLIKEIGNNNFSGETILNTESDILTTINFDTNSPTIFELTTSFIQ